MKILLLSYYKNLINFFFVYKASSAKPNLTCPLLAK